jgi:hypothetical protein
MSHKGMNCLWETHPQIPTLQDKSPPPGPWRLPPLFGTNGNGKTQVWQIGYDGQMSYYTCYGLLDGKKRTVNREITLNSSGRSYTEQAFLECFDRYRDKWTKDGYREHGSTPIRFTKPMLANTYDPEAAMSFPIAAQPKLDGIRLLVSTSPEHGIVMHSRNGRQYSYPHFYPELTEFFRTLPPDCVLDGEIYKHGWEFERLTSAASTDAPTCDTVELEYHIYDVVMAGSYDIRYEQLHRIFQSAPYKLLQPVRTDLVHSATQIEEGLQFYLRLGYEGIMLRRIPQSGDSNTHYVFGRSSNLLKHKPFHDTEVRIVGVESAEGTEAGCAVFIVDWQGVKRLSVRPKGTHEERRVWLQYPNLVLGKMATIRYNDTTKHGVPRFPRLHSIRDYE